MTTPDKAGPLALADEDSIIAEPTKCSVRDGRFVEPCTSLSQVTDNLTPGSSKAKGIARWSLTNMVERRPSRTYFGVKSKTYPNGFLFNFCPFCGEKIDAPFAEPDAALAQEKKS